MSLQYEVMDAPAQDDSASDFSEVPDISGEIQEALNLSSIFRSKWDRCLEYVRGNQNIAYNSVTQQYNTAKASRKLDSVVINQLLPLYRNVSARLATAYPSMAVLPASATTDDMLKSQSSELMLRYFWNADGMQEKFKTLVQWLTTIGNVAFHERYDAEKDVVTVEVLEGYKILFEPYATCPEESEWVCIRRFVRKKDAQRAFPKFKSVIEENEGGEPKRTYGPQSVPRGRVELHEIYFRDGMHVIMMNGTVLWKGEMQTSEIPIQWIRYTEIPGFLYGLGLLEPALEIQDIINQLESQVLLNAKLMSNPKVMIPVEGKVAPNAFSAKEGEKVLYEGGAAGKPTAWQHAPIPSYVIDQIPFLQSACLDVAGIHSVSLGKRPIGASSGKALDALSDNDLSQLQLTQQNIEHATQLMATRVLELMQKYYTEGKSIRMLDATGSVVWRELHAERLCSDPEVFLEAGSLFRSEAEDRDARTMDLLKAGLITPEEAKTCLSFRTMPLDISAKLMSMQHAKEVLEACAVLGAPVEVYPTDDLVTFEKVWSQYMQSSDFYKLPKPNQEAVAQGYKLVINLLHPNNMPQATGAPVPSQGPATGTPAAGGDRGEGTVGGLDQPMQQAVAQGQPDQMVEQFQRQPEMAGQTA